jgi:general secretion pathway protein K
MLVLWVIVVLGAIAASVVTKAREALDVARTVRNRATARYAAESGVAAAKVRLEELYAQSSTPEARAAVFSQFDEEATRVGERALGTARYQVVVVDLSSRVDLNQAAPTLLLGLFGQVVGERDAQALVDALVDWRDRDRRARPGGAEAAQYAAAGSPFEPPNGPLWRLDELTRIRGFSDSIADLLAPYITVRGVGRINLNTAPRPVLAALPQLGAEGADAVIAARAGGRLLATGDDIRTRFSDQGAATSLPLQSFTTVAERILVISRGWEDGSPLTHEVQAVLQLQAGAGAGERPRLALVHWTERAL